MADVGVPDGAIGSLVVRPWQWFRAYGGGGSNSVSKGWRGGFSLVPFGAGPSVSLEYGHYNDGDANGLVRRMVSGSSRAARCSTRSATTTPTPTPVSISAARTSSSSSTAAFPWCGRSCTT
jgi:hypothetical protein